MITARFYVKKDKSIHMTIRGHADAAPKGEDLVCCAATTIAYTVAQAVQFIHEQNGLIKKPKIRLREGSATIIATPTEEMYAQVLNVFWVGQCGCHVLARNYPKHVSLEHMQV